MYTFSSPPLIRQSHVISAPQPFPIIIDVSHRVSFYMWEPREGHDIEHMALETYRGGLAGNGIDASLLQNQGRPTHTIHLYSLNVDAINAIFMQVRQAGGYERLKIKNGSDLCLYLLQKSAMPLDMVFHVKSPTLHELVKLKGINAFLTSIQKHERDIFGVGYDTICKISEKRTAVTREGYHEMLLCACQKKERESYTPEEQLELMQVLARQMSFFSARERERAVDIFVKALWDDLRTKHSQSLCRASLSALTFSLEPHWIPRVFTAALPLLKKASVWKEAFSLISVLQLKHSQKERLTGSLIEIVFSSSYEDAQRAQAFAYLKGTITQSDVQQAIFTQFLQLNPARHHNEHVFTLVQLISFPQNRQQALLEHVLPLMISKTYDRVQKQCLLNFLHVLIPKLHPIAQQKIGDWYLGQQKDLYNQYILQLVQWIPLSAERRQEWVDEFVSLIKNTRLSQQIKQYAIRGLSAEMLSDDQKQAIKAPAIVLSTSSYLSWLHDKAHIYQLLSHCKPTETERDTLVNGPLDQLAQLMDLEYSIAVSSLSLFALTTLQTDRLIQDMLSERRLGILLTAPGLVREIFGRLTLTEVQRNSVTERMKTHALDQRCVREFAPEFMNANNERARSMPPVATVWQGYHESDTSSPDSSDSEYEECEPVAKKKRFTQFEEAVLCQLPH